MLDHQTISAMKRNQTVTIPTNSTITIHGVTFNGLADVKNAVEAVMRIEINLFGKRWYWEKEAKALIPGL